MDKTKVGIGVVIGGLVIYALYRNYQSATGNNTDTLPAQSDIAYYTSPAVQSSQDGIQESYENHPVVSQCITKQDGKFVMYNGQPQTYPMV